LHIFARTGGLMTPSADYYAARREIQTALPPREAYDRSHSRQCARLSRQKNLAEGKSPKAAGLRRDRTGDLLISALRRQRPSEEAEREVRRRAGLKGVFR